MLCTDRLTSTLVRRDHIDTTSFDSEWYEVVNNIVDNCRETSVSHPEWGAHKSYNSKINLHEVAAGLSLTNDQAAPGPDIVHPKMFVEAGNAHMESLLHLYQSCWSQNCFPKPWKRDNRIYLGKPKKDDYHIEKAYRSVSLNAAPGKCYERIIARRLVGELREIGFFDQPQFAYIKGLDTTQALMYMTLQIQEAFKNKQKAAAVFIDLEGAFDAIWRNGVLYKLLELGIIGKLWLTIADFLSDRYSRNLVNTHTSEWIKTELGSPQGSILSVFLFLVHFGDISALLPSSHSRYSDDLQIWRCNTSIADACLALNTDLVTVENWCNKWRLTANTTKTVVMAFSQKGHIPINIQLKGVTLKQVTEEKCLGVIVDENMNFKAHVIEATARGMAALRKVSVFSRELGGASQEVLLTLYKGCTRPLLELSYSAWCSARDIEPLCKVQNQALVKATGAMHGSSISALEAMCGIPPLDLRLNSRILLTYAQIKRQPKSFVLHKLIDKLSSDPAHYDHRIITFIHKSKMAMKLLIPHLNLDDVEPVFHETMVNILQKPIPLSKYPLPNEHLGSSGNRSAKQVLQARNYFIGYLHSVGNDAVAMSDGSALTNPGPCGAASAIYWQGINSSYTLHTEPISAKSDSYHGELAAINLTLEAFVNASHLPFRKIHIMPDCQSAISTVANPIISDNHVDLQLKIRNKHEMLLAKGIEVDIKWTAGHIGLKGNDIADGGAKLAAQNAGNHMISPEPNNLHITKTQLNKAIKVGMKNVWQRRWNLNSDTWSHCLMPYITLQSQKSLCDRKPEVYRNRLILGHCKLKDRMNKIMPSIYTSPVCQCGEYRQTVEHFLLHCSIHREARDQLLETIERCFLSSGIPSYLQRINVKTILCPDIKKDFNVIVNKAVAKYLVAAATEL